MAPSSEVMTRITLALAMLYLIGCSKSRCERLAEKWEKDCVAQMTRKFYVDGEVAGQLQSDADARKGCHAQRASMIADCEKWSDDVFHCAEKQYDDLAAWKSDARCQAVLEQNYAKTHPSDAR